MVRTLGILGGGQLGRMTALAAARLGLPTHIFCQHGHEPAAQVTPHVTLGSFDDEKKLAEFAAAVDVITLEWENVPLQALALLATHKPVYPAPSVLAITQDRVAEKTFAQTHGMGTAPFAACHTLDDVHKALAALGTPAILKTNRMGYDGKGQVVIQNIHEAEKAWNAIAQQSAILEGLVDFACEISVIIARDGAGKVACYPPVHNRHTGGILCETLAPAMLSAGLEAEARQMAETLAHALNLHGLLAVEMFVLKQPAPDGKNIVMNEMAPRPHNSGHWTMDAAATSQFEQLVRAVCGLPLGSTQLLHKARMINVLGDDARTAGQYLSNPQARLHLYGKDEIKPGRKMGHVTFLEET